MSTAPHAVALADQLQAATADAHHQMTAAAATGAVRLTIDIPTPWLTEQFGRLTLALTYGAARLCPHVGPTPRVVHAAAWAPGLLVCPACRWLLTPTPAEDSTCDRCRQPSPRLHAAIAGYGPVLLGYGLCPPCHTEIG